MKTIGILGGIGPQATMDLEQRIHAVSQQRIKQSANRGYPPMVVHYFREAPMVFDKKGEMPDVLAPHRGLLAAAQQLGAVADFLIIASNSPHFFVRQIEEAAGKPVLSIVDLVLEEVKRRQLKKVGVLATGKSWLYQDRLDEIGVAWETIPDFVSEQLDEAIYDLMEGKTRDAFSVTSLAINYLRHNRENDGIILGCTEIPLLYGSGVDKEGDLINPAALLAEAAVKRAISSE
jgi:aspartate racemase